MRVDISQFLKDQLRSSATPGDELTRPEYRESGHPSTNMAATTFGTPKPDVRDIAEQVDQTVPSHLEFAPSFDGAGDKAQSSGKEQAFASNETVGPLTSSDWEAYKNRLGQRESGNDYSKVNQIGFCGRWQFGAPALQDLGYVAAGTSTRALVAKSSWLGRDGIDSRKAFLSNTKVQDDAILRYTRMNYKALLRMKVITTSSPKSVVAGYLAAAHLKGAGGARSLKNGRDNADANGTKASEYYQMMASQMGGTNSDPLTAAVAGSVAPDADMEALTYVSQNVQPDAASFAFPSSPAAPRYPYNKVFEYESGHFKEYDSTPGAERIQERHKTGTGYEILPDGSSRHIVVGSNYTAVMGNDYILVNGVCQVIVNGDCGLRVNGTLNQTVANDYNLLVGGRYNVVVNGDMSQTVQGSQNVQVIGDKAEQVGGFLNVGVDGDWSIKAASLNGIAADGNVSLGATGKMSLVSMEDMSLNTPADISVSAKGSIGVLAKGSASFISQTGTLVAAVGGKATLAGADGTTVYSGGAVKLHGSAINATPKVDRAEWADRGGVVRLASGLGGSPGSAPSAQGSDGDGGSGDKLSEGTKNTEEKKVKAAIEQYSPIDASKTQAYGSGDSSLKGYNDGFDYEAETETA